MFRSHVAKFRVLSSVLWQGNLGEILPAVDDLYPWFGVLEVGVKGSVG